MSPDPHLRPASEPFASHNLRQRFIAHRIGLCYHKLTFLSLDYVQRSFFLLQSSTKER